MKEGRTLGFIWSLSTFLIMASCLTSCRNFYNMDQAVEPTEAEIQSTSIGLETPSKDNIETGEIITQGCMFQKNKALIPEHCDPESQRCEPVVQENELWVLECTEKNIQGFDLSHKFLKYSLLTKSDLSEVNLTDSDLLGSHGDWAKFEGIKGERVNFSHGMLTGAFFKSALLIRARFVKAHLLQANFHHAQLTEANFHSANLRKVNFRLALLKDASFVKADLSQANLQAANLWGADFTGANVQGADFTKARHLKKTKGLSKEIIDRFDK